MKEQKSVNMQRERCTSEIACLVKKCVLLELENQKKHREFAERLFMAYQRAFERPCP